MKTQLADVKQRMASLANIQNEIPAEKFEELFADYRKEIENLEVQTKDLTIRLNVLKEEIEIDNRLQESTNSAIEMEINQAKFMLDKGAISKQGFDNQVKLLQRKMKQNTRIIKSNLSVIKNLNIYANDITTKLQNSKSAARSNIKRPIFWGISFALICICVLLLVLFGKEGGTSGNMNSVYLDESSLEDTQVKNDKEFVEYLENDYSRNDNKPYSEIERTIELDLFKCLNSLADGTFNGNEYLGKKIRIKGFTIGAYLDERGYYISMVGGNKNEKADGNTLTEFTIRNIELNPNNDQKRANKIRGVDYKGLAFCYMDKSEIEKFRRLEGEVGPIDYSIIVEGILDVVDDDTQVCCAFCEDYFRHYLILTGCIVVNIDDFSDDWKYKSSTPHPFEFGEGQQGNVTIKNNAVSVINSFQTRDYYYQYNSHRAP